MVAVRATSLVSFDLRQLQFKKYVLGENKTFNSLFFPTKDKIITVPLSDETRYEHIFDSCHTISIWSSWTA